MTSTKHVTICGIGSLLSEKSALLTTPNVKNFRKGRIYGYKRCFNLVGISCIIKNLANLSTREVATVSAVPTHNEQDELLVTLFEIEEKDWPSFFEREHRYEHVMVDYYDYYTKKKMGKCYLCCQSTDEEYKAKRCKDVNDYFERVGKYWKERLWFTYPECCSLKDCSTILPVRKYLNYCLDAAFQLGDDFGNNFLDTSLLADGKTTIRQYIQMNPHVRMSNGK